MRSVTPVIGDDVLITARDGTQLPLRRWDADGKPRAVIVALHGMSDYSNAFDMPGKVWAKLGITTLAYDQRGFGRSDNPGIWAGADAMRADLNDAVAAARARYPGVPVFALGESMGGAVVLTALASAASARRRWRDPGGAGGVVARRHAGALSRRAVPGRASAARHDPVQQRRQPGGEDHARPTICPC